MKNFLIRLLSINPIFSLFLVVLYVALSWVVTATIWNYGHEIGAIIFAVTLSFITKSQSKSLINKLKSLKAEQLTTRKETL
jgi:hypothetical protein